MTRIFLAALYYVIAVPILVIAQRMFQTENAGPGLNIYVFIVLVIFSFYLLLRNLRTSVIRPKESYTPVFIHVGGLILILYLIFFDQIIMMKH
jgi:hypothetical protein